MKTFQQFNEDLKQLQRDLNTLDRSQAPKARLEARRRNALHQSKTVGSEFNARASDQVAYKKEKIS